MTIVPSYSKTTSSFEPTLTTPPYPILLHCSSCFNSFSSPCLSETYSPQTSSSSSSSFTLPSPTSTSFNSGCTHQTKESQRLAYLESLIDLNALSSTTSLLVQEYPYQLHIFKNTVLSIHQICQEKLYKVRKCSLEDYFKSYYNISRAQVYRIVDTAQVLLDLTPLDHLPVKQRVCQTLKKVTPSPLDRRHLWCRLLSKMHASKITSKQVKETWKSMLMERAHHQALMESTIHSLQLLIQKGIYLEPMVQGEWIRGVKEWRFCKKEEKD